ncbi:hypothetical protein CB1_001652046 [Camelus ferus]|nr:hypothetical protein CB1_001652046 [Camelus ferus]
MLPMVCQREGALPTAVITADTSTTTHEMLFRTLYIYYVIFSPEGLSCPLDMLCCDQRISHLLAVLPVHVTASDSLKMPTASSIN